jgi:hypothetical protein
VRKVKAEFVGGALTTWQLQVKDKGEEDGVWVQKLTRDAFLSFHQGLNPVVASVSAGILIILVKLGLSFEIF